MVFSVESVQSVYNFRDVSLGADKSETVKYGHEYQSTRTLERLRWQGPAAYNPSSRQRGGPTKTRP
jgi:hypothetical protein